MEKINILLSGALTSATVIGVGIALAGFLSEFKKVSDLFLSIYLTSYIVIICLFILWLRREIK